MDVFEVVQNDGALLDALIDGERTAGELVCHPARADPTDGARHLRVLREVGLVEVRPDAQRRIYALRADGLVEIDESINRYRRYWADHLDAFSGTWNATQGVRPMSERNGRLLRRW